MTSFFEHMLARFRKLLQRQPSKRSINPTSGSGGGGSTKIIKVRWMPPPRPKSNPTTRMSPSQVARFKAGGIIHE